jgi:hypothetical protein
LNQRKHQSTIIVLATLGVYLGLALTGAAPQILSQAAMARQFDVKDETEKKDDLDNKPDEKRTPVAVSVQVYLEDVEYFLASLGRLKAKGQFDPRKDTFNVSQSALLPCVDSNIAGRYTPVRFASTSLASRPVLDRFSRGMAYGFSLGDCVANNEFNGITAADSRFTFGLDEKSFSVTIAVKKRSPQRALDLVRELESTLALYAERDNGALRQNVVSGTAFRAENDQVFVITRLPRAGLESLLAIDAK